VPHVAAAVATRSTLCVLVEPHELLEYLRETEDAVVPFIGAGMAIPAGAPRTADLAAMLATRAGVADGSLLSVTTAATAAIGLHETKVVVADIIAASLITPTPALVALAQWPDRRLLTTNYDGALEAAATQAGFRPVTLTPYAAEALRAAPDGAVNVIHAHGHISDPQSIVLPGQATTALAADGVFMNNLHALMQQSVVLYLGFRFGPGEFPLREAMAWLTAVDGVLRHILVLPAAEAATRGEELEVLGAMGHVELVLYDP
jgi:hypothetical protein